MLILKKSHVFLPYSKTKIKPAKYIKIRDKIKNLKNERRVLLQEYWDMQYKIIYTNAIIENKYTKVITNIEKIDKEIEEMNVLLVPYEFYKKDSNNFTESYKMLKEQDVITNKDIKNIIKIHTDVWNKGRISVIPPEPSFLLEPSEEIPIDEANTEMPIIQEKKQKRVIYRKILDTDQMNTIKEKVKELLKDKLKAKNVEECKSAKRSAAYYMNKDTLVKEIEKEQIFKNIMPKNYKSLPKEKICEHLFFDD